MPLLIIIFFAIPLLELYIMIEVGSDIGAIPTIALTVFTAVFGLMLTRMQGLSVLLRVRETMQRGEVPALEVLEGAALMLAGVMLFLPGFVTDSLGFILLITPIRRRLLFGFLRRSGVQRRAQGGSTEQQTRGRIIDGEFHRDD